MGSWGFYNWPSEPRGLSDEEWWEWEGRLAEIEATPTHEEMMAMEDSGMAGCEIGEWQG